jgi:hypothetical protein
MRLVWSLGIVLISILTLAMAPEVDVTLRGSPASMERQHEVAVTQEYPFVGTPAQAERFAEEGRLVRIPGGPHYELHRVSYSVALPEVKLFVKYISDRYRAACGEKLVVTSLTRPQSEQPSNAHQLSVHPAGMAVDFRISQSPSCREWMEETLLSLERQEALDATRERNPPHYHVAIFPEAFRAYAARHGIGGSVQAERLGADHRAGDPAGVSNGEGSAAGLPRRVVAILVLSVAMLTLLGHRVLRSMSRRRPPGDAPPE